VIAARRLAPGFARVPGLVPAPARACVLAPAAIALGLTLTLTSALTLVAPPAAAAEDRLVAHAARIRASLVLVWYQSGGSEVFGSGFVISRDGHVLTSRHVVGDRDEVTVTFEEDGTESNRRARVVLVNDEFDFAVIHADDLPLAAATLGASGDVSPGRRIAHYGFPFGRSLDELVVPSLRAGIVSAVRPWRLRRGGDRVKVIQIDTTTSKGDSGSPLFDSETGAVIGVLKGHVKGLDDLRNAGGDVLDETQVIDLRVVQTSGVGIAVPIDPIAAALRAARIPFQTAR
jgi:S1-C subfamily serine protease